jgi:hypothetical protein
MQRASAVVPRRECLIARGAICSLTPQPAAQPAPPAAGQPACCCTAAVFFCQKKSSRDRASAKDLVGPVTQNRIFAHFRVCSERLWIFKYGHENKDEKYIARPKAAPFRVEFRALFFFFAIAPASLHIEFQRIGVQSSSLNNNIAIGMK